MDIPGAQHDTVHWKLHTNRIVDPIDPQYIGLDGVPLDDALYRCPTPPNPTSIPQVRTTENIINEKENEIIQLTQQVRELKEKIGKPPLDPNRSIIPTMPPINKSKDITPLISNKSTQRSRNNSINNSKKSSKHSTPHLTPLNISDPVSPINIDKTNTFNNTISSVRSTDSSKNIVITHSKHSSV